MVSANDAAERFDLVFRQFDRVDDSRAVRLAASITLHLLGRFSRLATLFYVKSSRHTPCAVRGYGTRSVPATVADSCRRVVFSGNIPAKFLKTIALILSRQGEPDLGD
jgi:hypothetical protein